MEKPSVNIIAAIGRNREIGINQDLIWPISADIKRFKSLTSGHPIIMGMKTYLSIGRPLPNRVNIILSKDSEQKIEGCIIFNSLDMALAHARSLDEKSIFIIGGGIVYTHALPFADQLHLTLIDAESSEANVFFPEYEDLFVEKSSDEICHDEKKNVNYRFALFEKIK